MQNRKLNCAVVGLGIGEQHALAILENPNCRLAKIVELKPEKTIKFINERGLSDTSVASFNDIIADPNIDLICLASYDHHHYGQVREGLLGNKNIFVEKPLCQTKEQLRNIHLEWKTRKKTLSANLLLRKAPLYQYMREIILQGSLGEIYGFDGDYLYGRVYKITDDWRKDVENYSVMEGGGVHIVDLMLFLTGQKPIMAISHKNKIATRNTPFRYHDFQSTIFEFESGLIGRITANFACVHKHQHVIRIFGTKGTFIHDDMGARIHWSRDELEKPEFIDQAPKPAKKGVLIHDLVQKVIQNKEDEDAVKEFNLMSVVLASDESLLSGKPQTIEYLTC